MKSTTRFARDTETQRKSQCEEKQGEETWEALFSCVAIVGVGLMGGSLGMALKERGLARRVVGIDANPETLARARELSAIDVGTTESVEAAREADFIVLAAPVRAIPSILEQMAPHVRSDALVTDMGSTKARIVETGTRLLGARFVGGHPMAGSEQSGIEAARPALFEGAAWAVVGEGDARLNALISRLGAHPVFVDAAQHDRLVALVSHLPHVLSFAFARTVIASPDGEAARELAGGSYQDLMRVSHADPQMWRDIFLENRAALLAVLAEFETELGTLKQSFEPPRRQERQEKQSKTKDIGQN